MASSQARRDMLYITFGDDSLKSQIESLYRLLKEQDVNVGKISFVSFIFRPDVP